MRRRDLLKLGLASLTVGGLPRARAADAGGRRFVFVVNYGGWDPLLVFAPLFGSKVVEMEDAATEARAGDIPFVDHPDRPSVRAFFERWYERAVVVQGMLVPSVAHPPSQRALMTGSTNEAGTGDWAARIAAAGADRYVLPGVVLSGPSYPGALGGVVCRTGADGQLDRLLGGTFGPGLDVPVDAPSPAAQDAVGRWLAARGEALAGATDARDAALFAAWTEAHARAEALKARRDEVVWGSTATWDDQIARTVEILHAGLARTVTLSFSIWNWDTHAGNDTYQSINYEGLFAGLHTLMQGLADTPGEAGSLADETVVVVLSEMGRTPLHNGNGGRDHWPYTSALLVGPGLVGNRVVGGWDELYYGRPVDLATGEADEGGVTLTPAQLGATLLALAGEDPDAAMPGAGAIEGVLA